MYSIAHARSDNHQDGVGRCSYIDLHLAYAHRLHHHRIETCGVQHPDHAGNGESQTPSVTASGHGANENAGRSGLDHPDSVTQDGAPGEGR